MMNAIQVKNQIEEELISQGSPANWYGLDLDKCMIYPVKKIYKDGAPGESGNELELWLVLEEMPDTRTGYKVVYNESENEYGLAICSESIDVFIGYYGTFLETLQGM